MVDRPKVGILLSPHCLIWTQRGLLTVNELDGGEKLIGIDRKGELSSHSLLEKPSFNGPRELVSIITERSSTILAGDVEIYTSKGITKIKNINEGDRLEMLSSQKCLDIVTMIKVGKDDFDEVSLTEKVSYLLGKSKFKTRKTDEIVFTVQNEKELKDTVLLINKWLKPKFGGKIFQRMSKRGYTYVSGGISIVYRSKNFCELCSSINIEKDLIPKFLRNNGFNIMQEFFLGFLERCKVSSKLSVIKLRRQAPIARAFIQNIAWVTGKNVVAKYFIEDDFHVIKVLMDKNTDRNLNQSNFSKVISKYSSIGPAYTLHVPANWDPIIDNLYVRRHNIKYPNISSNHKKWSS